MANANPKATSEKERDDMVEAPAHLKVDSKVYDKMQGETFGGTSDILVIEVDQIVGPLTYLLGRETQLEGGKAVIHEAKDPKDGETYRLPIATNFRRQVEAANLRRGDTFYIKRFADVEKKKGVGAGQMMEMYQITVPSGGRAPVQAPAAAAV